MPSKVLQTLNTNDKSFSSNFKIESYDKDLNSSPVLNIWKDISFEIKQEEKINTFNFFYHEVKTTDSLESLAIKYYNNQNFWWLILLANEHEDPFDFISSALQNGVSIKIFKPEIVAKIMNRNNTSGDIINYLKGN